MEQPFFFFLFFSVSVMSVSVSITNLFRTLVSNVHIASLLNFVFLLSIQWSPSTKWQVEVTSVLSIDYLQYGVALYCWGREHGEGWHTVNNDVIICLGKKKDLYYCFKCALILIFFSFSSFLFFFAV